MNRKCSRFTQILVAIAVVAFSQAGHAEAQVKLGYGFKIPNGWVDGLTFSLSSRAACQRLLAQMPKDSPAGAMARCLVRVDPNAKPLPTSQLPKLALLFFQLDGSPIGAGRKTRNKSEPIKCSTK